MAQQRWNLVGILLACGIFVWLTVHPLPSPDIWWQLANGRLIATQHSIQFLDPFSFTAPGHAWQNDEWLFSWICYGLYSIGGLELLQLCKSLLLMLTLAVAVRHAQQRTGSHPLGVALLAVACMGFSEYGFFFDVRPQLFTYFFATLFAWLCYLYVDSGQRRYLLPLPALTVLWGNLHPGVVAGPVLLGVVALGAGVDRTRRDRCLPLVVATLASLAGACLNEAGPAFLIFPFRLWHSMWSEHLNEWQGLLVRGPEGWSMSPENRFYALYLLATLLVMLLRRKRLAPWEMGLVTAFGLLSWTGWRHVPLFCFLSIPVWASMLFTRSSKAERAPGRAETWDESHHRVLQWGVSALALVSIGVRLRGDLGRQSLENELFPRWACDFMTTNHISVRPFHRYGWGGYLVWKQIPVFVDGRAIQAYPAQVYLDYLDAAFSPRAAARVLDQYQVDAALLVADPSVAEGSVRLLSSNPAWVAIYQDDLAAVYVRRTTATADWVSHLVYPDSPYRLRQQAAAQVVAGHLQAGWDTACKALELDPHNADSMALLGTLSYRQGRTADGDRWSREAVEEDANVVQAWMNLARSALDRGDLAAARANMQHAETLAPDNPAVQDLARRVRMASP